MKLIAIGSSNFKQILTQKSVEFLYFTCRVVSVNPILAQNGHVNEF